MFISLMHVTPTESTYIQCALRRRCSKNLSRALSNHTFLLLPLCIETILAFPNLFSVIMYTIFESFYSRRDPRLYYGNVMSNEYRC